MAEKSELVSARMLAQIRPALNPTCPMF